MGIKIFKCTTLIDPFTQFTMCASRIFEKHNIILVDILCGALNLPATFTICLLFVFVLLNVFCLTNFL